MNYSFIVDDHHHHKRLDQYLALLCSDLTRSHGKKLILEGHVSSENRLLQDPSIKVKTGQIIAVTIPPLEEANPVAEPLTLDIIYEEEEFLVLNKEAGMVVHPAYGHCQGTLVNALLHHCGHQLSGIRGVKMPGIVHRLDKDTSGLMVVAKSDRVHQALTQQFQKRTLSRCYQALVYGIPLPTQGQIQGNIGRHPHHRQKMAMLQRGGKEALTFYHVKETFGHRGSLVECRLHSGRTHQIRVHMTSLGNPLLGDPLYGSPPAWLQTEPFKALRGFLQTHPQQALHAYTLQFKHPLRDQDLYFEVPLSPFLITLRTFLAGDGQAYDHRK